MKSKRLGRAIRMARTELGESQEKFGERFGVGHGSVGVWERTGEIPEERWALLKKICGVDPTEYPADDDNNTLIVRHGSKTAHFSGGITLTPEEESLVSALRKLGDDEAVEIYKILGGLAERLKVEN